MFPNQVLLLTKTFNKSNFTNSQRGSALVIAVFIIVVMTVIGLALVRMLNASSESVAYEVIGTRAYATAQTGIQWAGRKVFPLGTGSSLHCDGTTVTAISTGSGAEETLTPPSDIKNSAGLVNCKIIELKCKDLKYNGVTYFTITSTGQCEVSGVITSRSIVIEARSL